MGGAIFEKQLVTAIFEKFHPSPFMKEEGGLEYECTLQYNLLFVGYKCRGWAWLIDQLKTQEKIKDVLKRKT